MKRFLIVIISLLLVVQPIAVYAGIPDDEVPFSFEENKEIKDKPKVVKVPKRAPVVPGAGAVLTTGLGMTPFGQELIDTTAQGITDLDYFLWEKLDMENWGSNISNGVISLGNGLGDIVSDLLLEFNQEQYPEIYVTAVDGNYYPKLSSILSTGNRYTGRIFFVENSTHSPVDWSNARVYAVRDYINLFSDRIVYGWSIYGSNDYLSSRTFTLYRTSDYYIEQAREELKDIEGLLFRTGETRPSSSSRFFKQLRERMTSSEFEEFSDDVIHSDENRHFPFTPNTHFPNIPESVPFIKGKPEINEIGVVEIDEVPHIEITVPNPWHIPGESPESVPEELPYYTPVEVENPNNEPEWIPGIVPTYPDGTPFPENPGEEPNPNPGDKPDPNPGDDPDPNPGEEPNPDPNPGDEPVPGGGITPPGVPPGSPQINIPKLTTSLSGLTYVFPFSIPWDVGRAFDAVFSGFGNEKPQWELPIEIGDKTERIKIGIPQMILDWTPFIHAILIIVFDIGVIYSIRKWFGGAT